jgi:hypothetical protein
MKQAVSSIVLGCEPSFIHFISLFSIEHVFVCRHLFTLSNAGVEGAVVVGKLLEQDNPDLGYDAAKGLPFSFQYPNGKK